MEVKNQIKLYQVHLIIDESQKSDKVVSSTPHHRWDQVKLINKIKLYQVHLTMGGSQTNKSDKVVSSTPHHGWQSN